MRTLTNCNLCGSGRFAPYSGGDGPGVLHRAFVNCLGCGIYFANPMATPAELDEFYRRQYYDPADYRMDSARLLAKKEGFKRTLVPQIRKWVGVGRFLEVGCGAGAAIQAARESGYEVAGLELSERGASLAHALFGLDVKRTTLEQAGFPDGHFDVVYAYHVIEHVPDLRGFLAEVRRVLRPGGYFLFGTENYRGLPNLISRANHMLSGKAPGLDTSSEHTFMFTPAFVRRELPRHGFVVRELRVYQTNHNNQFFRQARSRNPAKRAIHLALLAATYGVSNVLPVGGFFDAVLQSEPVAAER